MADYFPEGNTAKPFDNELRSLQKLVSLGATGGGGGGGSGSVIHIAGSGSPSTAPTGGAGQAYNDAGNEWFYTSIGWEQIM